AGAVVRVSDGEVLAKNQFHLGHASPIVQEGIVYAVEDGAVKAFNLPESSDQSNLHLNWKTSLSSTNRLASPICHEGLLYGVTEQGVLEVSDAKTGEQVYR